MYKALKRAPLKNGAKVKNCNETAPYVPCLGEKGAPEAFEKPSGQPPPFAQNSKFEKNCFSTLSAPILKNLEKKPESSI